MRTSDTLLDSVQQLLKISIGDMLNAIGIAPGQFSPIHDERLAEMAKDPSLVENLKYFSSFLLSCIKERLNK